MTTAWDFFVSYTSEDRRWAEWVASQLEDAGYRVLVQAWDMVAGSNLATPRFLVRCRSLWTAD